MDHSTRNGSTLRRENSSLGILNMDKLKGRGRFFGDLSTDSFKNHASGSNESGRRISDHLNRERVKALEALQKCHKGDIFKKPHAVTHNKENFKSAINVSSNNPSIQLDHTDYVPYRRPKTVNISDLVTDETINLETSSLCPSSASKDVNKVSFEPSEITGRSTLYKRDIKISNNIESNGEEGRAGTVNIKSKNISVCDILASSFASKARNLCETLQDSDTTLDPCVQQVSGAGRRHIHHGISSVSSSTCSSFTCFNGSRSLPRTADMSLSKNTCSEESFRGGFGTFSFSSAGAGAGCDESGYINEEFAPGELMQSKLINDEISWAQEYAAIPKATLSKQAKAKAAQTSALTSNGFDSSSISNSIIAGDPNFSVGNFFSMRSDNIRNIVTSKSPDKCRTPVALVDEENNNTVTTTTAELESPSEISLTPKIDNKTYTRVGAASLQIPTETSLAKQSTLFNRHESKDSGNSTDNSYMLSMSAIDRALCNLDNEKDTLSGVGLLMQAIKSKPCTNSPSPPVRSKVSSLETDILGANETVSTFSEMILENKENLDPETIHRVEISDTMSFTESLLNSSDMKSLQRSTAQPRSPLSPIEVGASNVAVIEPMDGEEADNDEFPDAPITENRRMRRTKSPHDRSPSRLCVGHEELPDATTPVNSRHIRSYATNKNSNSTNNKVNLAKEPKSLSSTRLDGCDRNASADCNFAVSPNAYNGHHHASSLVVRSNSLVAPQLSPRIASPARLDNTPQLSPRSYQLPQVYSPITSNSGFRSPNLDTTSHSDRQLLTAEVARKVVSSPVGSEASSSCSYGTLQTYRSAMSGGTSGRSISRCSSSSEFSHRDGKQIPLKVTNTELSWGSVKLRSDSRKSMQIKNIINKRLVIRIEVSGPGFQIISSQRNNTITLHSQECTSISISFCPTVRGVAIGKLSFYTTSGAPTNVQSFLDVPLYGYGGNASVIAQNILMAPVGNPFVTIGNVCELAQPLERTVSFYNKGPLVGFAVINIDSIGLMMPRLSDAFEIYPRKILIPPKHVINVRIVFRPKREEIKKIIKKVGSVLTLANMRVICGDEANRQRIRRLLVQMSEDERTKLSSPIWDMLWTKFPEEMEMSDLNDIRENPNVAMELASGFRIHEILLTINHENMDETGEASSFYLPEVDETVLFRTVCNVDSPTPPCRLGTVEEMFEEIGSGDADERAVTSTHQGSWSVKPNAIEINCSRPQRISLFVSNNFRSQQYFEVDCNYKQALFFTPCEGYVAPDGGQTEIKVGLHTNFQFPSGDVFIMVYMENERIMVPVKLHK